MGLILLKEIKHYFNSIMNDNSLGKLYIYS